MIGTVPAPYQPTISKNAFTTSQINDSGALRNTLTGKIIRVKNNPVDYRIVDFRIGVKELSLAYAVRLNKNLRVGSNIEFQTSQKDRLISIGKAVTAVFNQGGNGNAHASAHKICAQATSDKSVDLKSDAENLRRGSDFIDSSIDSDSPLAPTTYALGLNLGHEIKQARHDSLIANHFAITWGLSMKTAQEK